MWEPDQMTFCDHPVSYGPRVWFDFKDYFMMQWKFFYVPNYVNIFF